MGCWYCNLKFHWLNYSAGPRKEFFGAYRNHVFLFHSYHKDKVMLGNSEVWPTEFRVLPTESFRSAFELPAHGNELLVGKAGLLLKVHMVFSTQAHFLCGCLYPRLLLTCLLHVWKPTSPTTETRAKWSQHSSPAWCQVKFVEKVIAIGDCLLLFPFSCSERDPSVGDAEWDTVEHVSLTHREP